jgi:very-short-patch-repair endonuclease
LKIYYNPKLKERARELRRNLTYIERLLWKHLKGGQLLGYKFQRQKPIDDYIVDFYCSKLLLVIEIDGISHDGKQKYDKKRENRLKSIGLNVIRIDGYYVLKNVTGTLEIIAKKISELEGKTIP